MNQESQLFLQMKRMFSLRNFVNEFFLQVFDILAMNFGEFFTQLFLVFLIQVSFRLIQKVDWFLIRITIIKNVIFLTVNEKLKNFRHLLIEFKKLIIFLSFCSQTRAHGMILAAVRINRNMRITWAFMAFFKFIINKVDILNDEFFS